MDTLFPPRLVSSRCGDEATAFYSKEPRQNFDVVQIDSILSVCFDHMIW